MKRNLLLCNASDVIIVTLWILQVSWEKFDTIQATCPTPHLKSLSVDTLIIYFWHINRLRYREVWTCSNGTVHRLCWNLSFRLHVRARVCIRARFQQWKGLLFYSTKEYFRVHKTKEKVDFESLTSFLLVYEGH